MAKLTKSLDDVAMGALRDVGYDLEPLVDREIRGTSKDGLAEEILSALEELWEMDETAYLELTEKYSALLSAGFEADVPESGEPESGEPESGDGDKDDPEAGDGEETPEDGESLAEEPALPYAIQVREHAVDYRYRYGDILINPSRELVDSMVHAKLSEKGVRKLQARGSRCFNLGE